MFLSCDSSVVKFEYLKMFVVVVAQCVNILNCDLVNHQVHYLSVSHEFSEDKEPYNESVLVT